MTKDMFEWLLAHSYHIHEKEIHLLGMVGYKPEFHLGFRVFINNISSYKPPGGKSHSFIVCLDGSPLDNYMKLGMAPVPPITPKKRDSNKKSNYKTKRIEINYLEKNPPPQVKGIHLDLLGKQPPKKGLL